MTLKEFNELSGIEVTDMVVFDKINQVYMDSKSNKYDFVSHLMIEFKNWVWKNLEHLLLTNKEQLINHFVIYELDYYPNL